MIRIPLLQRVHVFRLRAHPDLSDPELRGIRSSSHQDRHHRGGTRWRHLGDQLGFVRAREALAGGDPAERDRGPT